MRSLYSHFGDPQRVITFTGGGYYKGIFGGGEIGFGDSSDLIANNITSEFRNSGWDIRTVSVTRSWFNPNWYSVVIDINALPNDNPARIQQGLLGTLSNYFDQPQLDAGATQNFNYDPTTGQIVVTDTYKDQTSQANQPSLWEQIFGKSSVIDASGKVLGLSVGTLALVAVGYFVITSRKR